MRHDHNIENSQTEPHCLTTLTTIIVFVILNELSFYDLIEESICKSEILNFKIASQFSEPKTKYCGSTNTVVYRFPLSIHIVANQSPF